MSAVMALLAVPRVFSWLRLRPQVPHWLLERQPTVLVQAGHVVPDALRRAHLTESDVNTLLPSTVSAALATWTWSCWKPVAPSP